jgi:hypothetical protein
MTEWLWKDSKNHDRFEDLLCEFYTVLWIVSNRRKSDAGSKTKTLNRKDAVLFKLVARYRQDNRHRDIAPLFIVLLRIEALRGLPRRASKEAAHFR